MEKLKVLIEEIKERIEVLEGDEEEILERFEDDFNPMDWSGGNFDDAYQLGREDEEILTELRVLQEILIDLEGMM